MVNENAIGKVINKAISKAIGKLNGARFKIDGCMIILSRLNGFLMLHPFF